MKWRLSLLVCMSLMVYVSGCSKKEDAPEPSAELVQSDIKTNDSSKTADQPVAEVLTFDQVLQLFVSGQQDKAVNMLLKIQWDQPDVFASDSVFRISEADFMGLPEDQRMQIQQKAMNLTRGVKDFLKLVVEQAKQKGEYEAIRKALIDCGKRLSREDQMLLIQMTGKSVVGYTEKELPVN